MTDTCDDARWQWRLIESQIVSPDLHDEMVTALDVMQDFDLVIDISVDEVAGALDEYAERIEGITSRYQAVMAEAQICYAPPTTAEEAAAARERDARIQGDVNELVRQLQAWEQECAHKIDEANRSDAVWDGGSVTTPQGGASMTAVETLLDHLGVQESVREEIGAIVVMTDVSPVDMTVTMADGTVYEWHALSLEPTVFVEKEMIVEREVKFLPDAKADLPPELKPIKHLLGPASVFLTAYSNYVDEWNDDLIENPEYSQLERIKSASVLAVLGTLGDGFGSAGGFFLAGAAALPSGPAAIGAAFGGDVVGGLTGEMIGNAFDNWFDGENPVEALDNSWRDSGIPKLLRLN